MFDVFWVLFGVVVLGGSFLASGFCCVCVCVCVCVCARVVLGGSRCLLTISLSTHLRIVRLYCHPQYVQLSEIHQYMILSDVYVHSNWSRL